MANFDDIKSIKNFKAALRWPDNERDSEAWREQWANALSVAIRSATSG